MITWISTPNTPLKLVHDNRKMYGFKENVRYIRPKYETVIKGCSIPCLGDLKDFHYLKIELKADNYFYQRIELSLYTLIKYP